MSLTIAGAGGTVAGVGAEAAKGLHHIPKPQAYGSLGHYRAVFTTGTIAAGFGTGDLLQMRWVDATRICIIQEVSILEFRNITTAFAAGPYNFKVFRATGWSADGTGGTAITVTSPQLKSRVSMGTSLFSTGFRFATTAALGAGTKTLDTNPMGAAFGNVGSTPAIAQLYIPIGGGPVTGYGGPGVELMHPDIGAGEHPLIIAQNEGLVLQATVPGTGTWIASVLVKWAEVDAF